jgi:cytoskeleton protein RodZ
MSETLGEKLRQAREAKGLTLSDVAEQTRISSLYLEAIENDDYKILPGGIFNKGFIKSYAKFVGVNEQDALMDYQAVLARSEGVAEHDQRAYRPEVLTDDRSGSMLPTIIVAALILVVMTVGILYLVSYLRAPSSATASSPNTGKPSGNTTTEAPPPTTSEPGAGGVPDMSSLKVEVKATSDVSVTATVDGGKPVPSLIHAGSSQTFEPKQSLKLSYSRSLASAVQLAINGKTIIPPATPLEPKRAVIEFEIDQSDLAQIWNNGSITPAPATDANAAAPAAMPKALPKTIANANTAPSNTALPKPTIQSRPTPKPTIITVGTPKTPHE